MNGGEEATAAPGLARMQGWVDGLAEQFREALAAAERAGWPAPLDPPRSIHIGGMGGSAMAGLVAGAILHDRLPVPWRVQMDPDLPAWVGPGTLSLAVSYSGETWESLASLRAAGARGATVLAVASGGTLERVARESGAPFFRIPEGYAPRAALGWLATAVGLPLAAVARGSAGEWRNELLEATALLEDEARLWRAGSALPGRDPVELAARLEGRLACIAAPGELTWPAALRWRNQILENGKQGAFATAFPELAHNEVVGWQHLCRVAQTALVVLEGGEPGVDGMRGRVIEAAVAEWGRCGGMVVRVPARGQTRAAVLLSHLLLADQASVELARLRGVDPVPIEAIARLKRACGKELER